MSNTRYDSLDTLHFARCRLPHGRPKDAALEIQSVRNRVTPRPIFLMWDEGSVGVNTTIQYSHFIVL